MDKEFLMKTLQRQNRKIRELEKDIDDMNEMDLNDTEDGHQRPPNNNFNR